MSVVDHTRKNAQGVESRKDLMPIKGILWMHNSYGGADYWFESGTFVEGDMLYYPDD